MYYESDSTYQAAQGKAGKRDGNATGAPGSTPPAPDADRLTRAVQLNPMQKEALLTQAKELTLAGDYPAAREMALRANRVLASAETFDQLGSIYEALAQGKSAPQGHASPESLETAQRYYAAALAINPADTEALEHRVWIAMLRLNAPGVRDKIPYLEEMLQALRDLQRHTLSNPNLYYLWAQYWLETATLSRNPFHYAAGYRAASLADNTTNPRRYDLLYKPADMFAFSNFFLMGARGFPVMERGKRFPAKRPVNLSRIRLHD